MTAKPTSMAQLKELLNQLGPKDVIADVRELDEFLEGHVPGARNFPLSKIAQFTRELAGFENVYIHCRAGRRAVTAFEALKQAGLTNLHCIHEDGMAAWEAAGFPTAKGASGS